MTRWHDKLSKSYQTRKPSKYKNETATHNGEGFRSKLERDTYALLLLMERAGEIANIRREQSIQLTPSISHKIDFVVSNAKTGADYGIEAKGAVDRDWSLKRRLYIDFGPFIIEIWRACGSGRVGCSETIQPGRYRWTTKD